MPQRDPSTDDWPKDYFEKTCGFLQEEMDEPDDAPPEPLDVSEIP